MTIEKLDDTFSVCKVAAYPPACLESAYCFIAKTDQENSLVIRTRDVPARTLAREDGWKAFRIQGVLDFSLTGVLAKLTTLLAENGIGVFAISTYNTDYLLTKQDNFEKALTVLARAGYSISNAVQPFAAGG